MIILLWTEATANYYFIDTGFTSHGLDTESGKPVLGQLRAHRLNKTASSSLSIPDGDRLIYIAAFLHHYPISYFLGREISPVSGVVEDIFTGFVN
jgi:hypothetical protein